MKIKFFTLIGILLSILLTIIACSEQNNATEIASSEPTANAGVVDQTYSDPFAYCAAVGTVDLPDAGYTGPQITDEIINGYKVAAGLEESTEPMDILAKTTTWRCMDGQVYACNFGANLPCSSKANTEKIPSTAMQDYCRENPDAEFIPMSVTGHSTIYSWHCVKDTPELLDQIAKVDAAGYLAEIWYAIEPVQNLQPHEESTPTPMGESGEILFSSNRDGGYDDLYLLDLANSQVTRLTNGDSNTFSGPFSPDGTRLLFTGFGPIYSYVGMMNADGSQPQDISQSPNSDEGFPAWSPDGQQIAFTSRRDGNNEIYLLQIDGSLLIRLTNYSGDDFAPAWSPDGTQIAFVSDRDNAAGIYNLYIMDADGSNIRRLTNGSEIDYSPAWSPDGNWIAFRTHHDGPGEIYRIRPDGTDLVNLTNNAADDWAPAWSPDGTLLAFQTNRDGNWEIYVMDPDGSNPRNLTQNPADDQMPFWKPLAQMANPASENCIQQGGTLSMETRGDLGEFGVCYFEDNRQCEEWALFRGECPAGGLKVTGYITDAARFCAITGGTYVITGDSGLDTEQGICTFKTGKTCDAWDYYNGKCSATG